MSKFLDPVVLIAAATRAAFAMGALYVLSYTLVGEDGACFRAAGWSRMEDALGAIEFGGGEWTRPSRHRLPMESPTGKKHRWERYNLAAREVSQREAA